MSPRLFFEIDRLVFEYALLHLRVVRCICAAQARTDLRDRRLEMCNALYSHLTPLHMATHQGHVEVVGRLIQLDSVDKNCRTKVRHCRWVEFELLFLVSWLLIRFDPNPGDNVCRDCSLKLAIGFVCACYQLTLVIGMILVGTWVLFTDASMNHETTAKFPFKFDESPICMCSYIAYMLFSVQFLSEEVQESEIRACQATQSELLGDTYQTFVEFYTTFAAAAASMEASVECTWSAFRMVHLTILHNRNNHLLHFYQKTTRFAQCFETLRRCNCGEPYCDNSDRHRRVEPIDWRLLHDLRQRHGAAESRHPTGHYICPNDGRWNPF